MAPLLGLIFTLWPVSRVCQGYLSDPWSSCPVDKMCKAKFANGICDKECTAPQCLRDGFDCVKAKEPCRPGYVQYCRDHYNNKYCEHSCNTAPCGWDGSDCFQTQQSNWAKGTLVLQTSIPFQKGPFQNGSLLWALSVLLQTSVKLRGTVPFPTSSDLSSLEPQQLVELHRQQPAHRSNGSLLFLQVDNRPCTRLQHACFPYAAEGAGFLSAMLELNHATDLVRSEFVSLVAIRGIEQEIAVKETIAGVPSDSPAWLWPVVGVAAGVGVALAVVGVALLVWTRRRRERRGGGERARHRSAATDDSNGSKAWTQRSGRGRRDSDRDRSGAKKKKKKKKKGKETGKRRSEPLGEDAIQMRPLRKALDIGSDTDVTQSSMEDITRTICDHRSPAQKHFELSQQQPTTQAAPRWERSPAPAQQRTTANSAPVQWCGPDGSVVLIRAVRSGLDRVVLELLRAGVPVNNTDHTGRSALHWACSVNHLSLARILIRYGAAVDLQDNKGETALFLAALHGCYETARFLLLNGANQDLTDRRGRRPIDVAQEALHHQVLELLLAHSFQRSPFPVDSATEVLWDDRGYLYSPWAASPPSLPGRSSSFSGVIGNRDLSSPPPSTDWLTSRAQCASLQNWRPMPNQSATALVSPRILGHPSRPISTLQEVTSEAEEEEREPQDISRVTSHHFLSPQPAPRQRSFSCTQHALQRRSTSNQSELPAPVAPEKRANEHVEIVIVPHPKAIPSQPESKSAWMCTNMAPTDSERERKKSCEQKTDTVSNESMSVQTVM